MMKRFLLGLGLVLMAQSVRALEAVVQSDVGSGSAVAGSIGAVNARADALQGNVNAVNMLVKQLQDRVTYLEKVVRVVTDGPGRPGEPGTPSGPSGPGVPGTAGVPGEPSVTIKGGGGQGSFCGYRLAGCRAWGWSSSAVYDKDVFYPWNYQEQGQGYNYSVYNIPCQGKPITIQCGQGTVNNGFITKVECPEGFSGMKAGLFSDTDSAYYTLYCVKN